MAAARIPGSSGLTAHTEPVDSGTLIRASSPVPGAAGRGDTHRTSNRTRQLPRKTRRPKVSPFVLLKLGDTGEAVKRLKVLLNGQLYPSPKLELSASFDNATLDAVRRLQHGRQIKADGIVGKDTWFHLLSGEPVRTVASGATVTSISNAPTILAPPIEIRVPSAANLDDEIFGWPLEKKFTEVLKRTAPKLSGDVRQQFEAMISPMSIGIMVGTLVLLAASHAFGIGEVIDLIMLGVGVFFLGTAVIDVAKDFGDFLVTTSGAVSERELDEAAADLSRVIAVIGVTALMALLAKIKLAKGRGAGSAAASEASAAEASAARAASAKRGGTPTGAAAAAEEAAATSIPKSNKPASPVGNACEKAGCPISMVTGEEMLELEDFTWEGPVPFTWRRFYRSGNSATNYQLGFGWLCPLDEWLEVRDDLVIYWNADGQRAELPVPSDGSYSVNLPEKLRLYRETSQFRLVNENGLERVFATERGRANLRGWRSRQGQSIDIRRNERGEVTGLVANWGGVLHFTRSANRITAISRGILEDGEIKSSGEPLVHYDYDSAGDLVSARNRLDQGERYTFQNHMLMQRTLASGFNFHFEWDILTPKGKCLRNWGDGEVYDTRFEWLAGGTSRAIDSRQGVTTFVHNANSQLVKMVSPEGRETRRVYNRNNMLSRFIDGNGKFWEYSYDPEGRIASVTDPLGHTEQFAYDGSGNLTRMTDPTGKHWIRRYDRQGRLTESAAPDGARTAYTYNAQGLLATVTDAVGRIRRLLWDERMRLVGEIGFDGVRTRYQYDNADRIVATVTQDRIESRYEYDAVGHVTAFTSPDGATIGIRYNDAGFVTHHIDAAGRITEYKYDDKLSQPTARIDPNGNTLRYRYDTERNLVWLVNAKGEEYKLVYDLDENLIEETGFDGRVQRYDYDATSALAAHKQRSDPAKNQAEWLVTAFERNALGQLLKKRGYDGATNEFEYNSRGQLEFAHNQHATLSFVRDVHGRVTLERQTDVTLEFHYDLLGRRIGMVTPLGDRVDYYYDQAGRLERVDVNDEALSKHTYDDIGQEIRRAQGALESQYEYDLMGRMLRHRAIKDSAQQVLGRRYDYDVTGKLATIADFRSGETKYVYDPADRLVGVAGLTPESFVHDPAGNLIGPHGESGLIKGDRLLMISDRHFTYDAAGNLVEERRGTAQSILTRYGYDSDNRLARVETSRGITIYAYDPFGRRVAKRSKNEDIRFTYDGLRLLTERSPAASKTYLFESDLFRPLARIDRIGQEKQGQIYFYQLDRLGTPQEMTDVRGNVVWSGRYRAYGSLALAEVEEVDNCLRFQGQYFDAETGFHYNLNRYYDPTSGRFINQDPIGLRGGENAYLYVRNPTNWIDPLGFTCKEMPGRGYHNETSSSKPVKSNDVVKGWDEFLGPGPHTNKHPRTGAVDPNRIVSADGKRSIRYGEHEMKSTPKKHHYHEETWTYDEATNVMNVDNTMVRISK